MAPVVRGLVVRGLVVTPLVVTAPEVTAPVVTPPDVTAPDVTEPEVTAPVEVCAVTSPIVATKQIINTFITRRPELVHFISEILNGKERRRVSTHL